MNQLKSQMKPPMRLALLSVLSLAGFLLSIVQTVHFFEQRNGVAGFKTFCTFGSKFDCQAIDASPYAQILPGYPLAAFAAGWFLALFISSLLARPIEWRREGLKAAMAMTSLATAFSVFYLFIMVAVLKTYCLLCLCIDVVNVTSFATAMTLMPGNAKKGSNSNHWKTYVAIGAAGIAFAFVLSFVLNGQAPSRTEVDEIVADTVNSAVVDVRISDDDEQWGPKDAPITIVKFSDFQCPACRRGAFSLHPLFKAFPGKIRFVYKNFPLDSSCNRSLTSAMHPYACQEARIGWCANHFGFFEEAYESLFEKQPDLEKVGPIKLVARSDAEANQLQACSETSEARMAVQKDIDEGIRLNIKSTPTFFINGRRVEGSYPPYVWTQVVQELLKTKP